MIDLATEHRMRVQALATGPRNPFCLSCGQLRERHGGTICRECGGVYSRGIAWCKRRELRASFALIDGGRTVRP